MEPALVRSQNDSRSTLPFLLRWRGPGDDIILELRSHLIRKLNSDMASAAPESWLLFGTYSYRSGVTSFQLVDCEPFEPGAEASAIETSTGRVEAWATKLGHRVSCVGICLRTTDPGRLAGRVAAIEQYFPPKGLILWSADDVHIKAAVYRPQTGETTDLRLGFPLDWAHLAEHGYAPFDPVYRSFGAGVREESAVVPASPAVAVAMQGVNVPAVPAAGDSSQVARPAEEWRAPAVRPTGGFRVPGWAWGALAGLSVCGLGLLAWQSFMTRPPSDSAPVTEQGSSRRLGLQVSKSSAGLEISWSVNAPAMKGVQSARLQIEDGGRRVDIPLGYVELNTGHVLYIPHTGDVQFVLTAFTSSGMAQEMTRVIGAVDADSGDSAAGPPAAAESSTRTRPGANVVSRSDSPVERVAAARTISPVSQPVRETARSITPAPTDAVANTQRPSTPSPSQPAIQTPREPVQDPATRAEPRAVAQNATPPVPQIQNQVPAETPRPSEPDPAIQSSSQIRQARVTAPVPVAQVTPVVPPQLKRLIYSPIEVEVLVKVGADGMVKDAITPNRSGISAHLARLAREAALRWKFQPATINGQAVPGDHKLRFRFAP